MKKISFQRIKSALVVDDSLAICELLKTLLTGFGLTVRTAHNGTEAIPILQEGNIDLLITDFRMPLMNGAQLLNWCRKNGLHLPVIMMSAEANLLESESIALGDCCATLMMKPLSPDVLLAALGAADRRAHHEFCVHRGTSGEAGSQ